MKEQSLGKTQPKRHALISKVHDRRWSQNSGQSLCSWTPSVVKNWLQEEGFQDFWPFLEIHQPTGLDLIMLTRSDWHRLFDEFKCNNPNSSLNVPSVIAINRLDYKLDQLKLPFQSLTANRTSLHQRDKPSQLPYHLGDSVSSADEMEQELDDELLLRPIEGEVIANGFTFKHHQLDSGDDTTDETEDLMKYSTSTNVIGPCPFCHHQIKREKLEILPERWKALLAFVYALAVSWVTAFVMVIVHDRVPDMEKYPPLPDILLDNIPHIPWAFEICEVTGMILISLWCLVLLFHKHRFVLMRRFFSISGTIFLLRCVTMLITSLSVPGKHLDCSPRPYGDIWNKMYNAYIIWTGAGMTLQGVRTCGDYMFSGHTVALTLLNFFITEYTSRRIYFLHTLTWICNVFGIFFILAAHEHYSIDVFVAFYITSRLFMYYHTLANQPVLHNQRMKNAPTLGHFSYDAHRVWLWFPMFSFFESSIDGKIPNEFEWPISFIDIYEAGDEVFRCVKVYSNKLVNLTTSKEEVCSAKESKRHEFKSGYNLSKSKKLKKK